MFINNLPLTRLKIGIAKIIYRLMPISLFKRNGKIIVERNGIMFDLDLSEGIDLSVFLFGNFQKHVTSSKYIDIPADAFILDIGGNFGIMALNFAKIAPQGEVTSFEPTSYAISKFEKNLDLNPNLASRITIINSFISNVTSQESTIQAFSSWKVDGTQSAKHPVHLGIVKSTHNVGSMTLDDYCEDYNVQKIDFIKIDTDGHEFEIFQGGKDAIQKFMPQIVFEVGGYVMREKGIKFSFYLDYFESLDYHLFDTKTSKKLNYNNHLKIIPELGTTDIIAIPKKVI